jgi:hypothetical protein
VFLFKAVFSQFKCKQGLTIPRLELVSGHMAVNLISNVKAVNNIAGLIAVSRFTGLLGMVTTSSLWQTELRRSNNMAM